MMIGRLGDTNVHIISRVGGSGTEWRLRELFEVVGIHGADWLSRGQRPLLPRPRRHAWQGHGFSDTST